MPESPWWLTALIAPFAYLVVVRPRFAGFRGQPGLVLARNPARFGARLADVGGAAAARTGVLVDLGFALLLCGAVGVVIAAAGGPWWLVLPALVLDFGEGLALWVIIGQRAPARAELQLLFGIAVAKFIAYGASCAALVWAVLELVF